MRKVSGQEVYSDQEVYIGRPPTGPGKPRKRRKTWPLVATAFAAAVLIAAGIVVAAFALRGHVAVNNPLATEFQLNGSVTVTSSIGFDSRNGTCWGRGGYDDMHEGAQVVISDASGTTVAIGTLGTGVYNGGRCVLPFAVPHVPLGKNFYGVAIGHRNAFQVSAADAQKRVELSIGD